jgi:hypothetical protein
MNALVLLLLATQGLAAWDTGQSSAAPLPPETLASRAGWTELARGQTPAAFKGDAVVTNGRLVAVVRRQGGGVDVYGAGPRRFSLALADAAPGPERVSLVENARGGLCLEVAWRTSRGASASAAFRLKRGELTVEVEPRAGAAAVQVECPSRFALLPDFFADDMVFDARQIPPGEIEVPSENFVIHPAAAGEALAMVVFQNRDQDVRLSLSGDAEARQFVRSSVQFGRGGKVWVTLLEGAGVWHAVDLREEDSEKVLPLRWTMPFVAQWRCNFTRADGLTDSWEFLLQEKEGGEYFKPTWLGNDDRRLPPDRKRWMELLGEFRYPVWSDPARRGFVQPLRHKVVAFRGPAVLYPLGRLPQTPPDQFTALDVLRNTLGVGPCEHVLDLEGQKESSRGAYTCHVRDRLREIYSKGEQKRRGEEIEKLLGDALAFVEHIRGRIEQYLAFRSELGAYLAEQRKKHPELTDFLSEMERLAARIDERLGDRKVRMKAPADVVRLNEAFRQNVRDYEGPDLDARLKKYTDELTQIGGNQDKLVMECRWVVKAIRQRAGFLMAVDPRAAPAAEEIRARTQKILRNPTVHEKARH